MSQSNRKRGYDALTADEVLGHLDAVTQADLAKLRAHERTHQNRADVLAGIDARLGEPWPGYDALDVSGVRSALDDAGDDELVTVLAYERSHRTRAEVLLAAQQHRAQDPA
jgi:hypothetical protein